MLLGIIVLLIAIAAGIAITIGLPSLIGRSASKAAKAAVSADSPQPIQRFADSRRRAARAGAYGDAIGWLWRHYHRELVARTLISMVPTYVSEPDFQLWLRELLDVEPEIAEAYLPAGFVEQYYQAEWASTLGFSTEGDLFDRGTAQSARAENLLQMETLRREAEQRKRHS